MIAQMGLLGVACLLPLDKLVCQGGLGGFSLVSEVDYFCLCMGHICGQAIHSSNHLSMHHPSVCLSIHPPTQLPIQLTTQHFLNACHAPDSMLIWGPQE